MELRSRQTRIREIEAQVAAATAAPVAVHDLLRRAEALARAKAEDLRAALEADLPGLREFPEGLRFSEAQVGRRRVWKVEGFAQFRVVAQEARGCKLKATPGCRWLG